MSDNDISMVSLTTPKKEKETVKKPKRVQDDFFAFHLEESVLPKKKKKKKKKRLDNQTQESSVFSSQDYGEVRALRQRDVTPPPEELQENLKKSSMDLVDGLIEKVTTAQGPTNDDDDDDDDLFEIQFSHTVDTVPFSEWRRLLKSKPGLKDQFKLLLNLSLVGIDSSLEVLVKGSSRVEKILQVVFEYLSWGKRESSKVIVVYDGIKLLNATQICNLLAIDKKLVKDLEDIYKAELLVMKEADYASWKEKKHKLLNDGFADSEEEEIAEAEDDEKFKLLNLHELELLASKSLKIHAGVDDQDSNSFKIILKASEKLRFVIPVHPDLPIKEIQQIALQKLGINNCKLMFDDEELPLQGTVKDTELEEDYIIDVVVV